MARTRTRSINEPAENGDTPAPSTRRRNTGDAVTDAARRDRSVTAARQPAKPRAQSQSLVERIPVVRSIASYLHGVRTELGKVTWPTREETMRLTGVVLGVTIAFSIALGLLDTFLTWWFQQAFHPDSETTFLIIALVVAALVGGTWTVLRNRI
ncbi:MAG: preprotein translocase subunit SecE [Chloroflexota bacterium]|nr:preprotein translocase subunit SecE [Anaerolineae bacterium]HMM29100.1 preprotein translocase subunit SecE [Aggregatilineaceae bacterium]